MRLALPIRLRAAHVVAGVLLALGTAALAHPASAQAGQARYGAGARTVVSGAVSVTSNGISTVPAFTLGEPAAIFDLSVGRGALSFDPQFRLRLDGKPWSFLFWGRYRVHRGERLRVSVGAHPALTFRTTRATANGVTRDVITARRFLAGELSPEYALTKRVGVGPYYLYLRGLEDDAARHTHLIAARIALTDLRLSGRYAAQLNPRIYYLRTDGRDGAYVYSALTLVGRGLPVSLSAVVNRAIRTNIPEGDDFLWNVSLTYAIR